MQKMISSYIVTIHSYWSREETSNEWLEAVDDEAYQALGQ